MFLVELITSSFFYLIPSRRDLNATVSAFLFKIKLAECDISMILYFFLCYG